MARNQKPALASSRTAKIVSAVAAAVLTWIQFSAVVSLAEEPPMAMAGYRGSEKVASSSAPTHLSSPGRCLNRAEPCPHRVSA